MDNQLAEFRAELDDMMALHPQSPLDPEQQAQFEGLAYYDEAPELALVLPLQFLPEDEPPLEMDTSTGDTRLFRRWARVEFSVDGGPAALTIYSDPHGHELFLPFRDATSGRETYGAGRYLDNHRPGLQLLNSTEIEIDFNYAYNPYCAYNLAYSCPLPPRENWLDVPIRAGEKDFPGHMSK